MADQLNLEYAFGSAAPQDAGAKLGDACIQMAIFYPNAQFGTDVTARGFTVEIADDVELSEAAGYAETARWYLSDAGISAVYIRSFLSHPMDTAPRTGTVIEALYDGDWLEVFWSERAYDGSPTGTTGFADVEQRLAQPDLEAWRVAAEPAFIDD